MPPSIFRTNVFAPSPIKTSEKPFWFIWYYILFWKVNSQLNFVFSLHKQTFLTINWCWQCRKSSVSSIHPKNIIISIGEFSCWYLFVKANYSAVVSYYCLKIKVHSQKWIYFLRLWTRDLLFSSTYKHQTLQFYCCLYFEGSCGGACPYIIHSLIHSENMAKMYFLFFSWMLAVFSDLRRNKKEIKGENLLL